MRHEMLDASMPRMLSTRSALSMLAVFWSVEFHGALVLVNGAAGMNEIAQSATVDWILSPTWSQAIKFHTPLTGSPINVLS